MPAIPEELVPDGPGLSPAESLTTLSDEYSSPDSPGEIRAKISDLLRTHRRWIRVLRDGNCAYRAVLAGLCSTQTGRLALLESLRSAPQRLEGAGYPAATTGWFIEDAIEVVEEMGGDASDNNTEKGEADAAKGEKEAGGVARGKGPGRVWLDAGYGNAGSSPQTEEGRPLSEDAWSRVAVGDSEEGSDIGRDNALRVLSDRSESMGLIMCARLLVGARIKADSESFAPFLVDHGGSVEAFCSSEVDCMNVEAGQLQLTALAQELGVRIVIQYLAGPGQLSEVVLPDKDSPGPIVLRALFRPGHYDILC